MLLSLYIPSPSCSYPIHPGSAIVGSTPQDDVQVLVYFEGNLYGAENMRAYEQRVEHAAGRLTQRYPTIAKAMLRPTDLVRVGSYETDAHLLEIEQPDALETWAGEKVVSGVTQWARDRELQRRFKEHVRRGLPFTATDLLRS